MATARRGYIRKRSNGSYRLEVGGILRADGSVGRVYRTLHGTKTDAERELTKLLRDLDTGQLSTDNATLRQFVEERWLPHIRTRVRARTAERYEQLLRIHVLPKLGCMPVGKVRSVHIQTMVDAVTTRGRAPRTALHVYRVLHAVFRQAVKWGVVAVNPTEGAEPPRAELPRLTVPTPPQLARLIEVATGTVWEVPVLLAATLGTRRSETLGVRWADVDLSRGTIGIRQGLQWQPDGKGGKRLAFLDVKTQRSRREVALAPFVIERLRHHKQQQTARRLLCGPAWQDHDLVSDRGDGGPTNPDAFGRAFKRLAKAAGLPPTVRLHDLRHAVATALLAGGVHPAVTSAVLGHTSPAFTMKTYQHVVDGMTERAAQVMEQVIRG
jgi:integrase